ncbi:bifunctional phosphopantothenoylcysteine decarboxylase/phosphopantothenate--cysteine ligase CoaBC [Micrococcales bacterium 31B]|nr:bifunctional phosphopantothenoylcysteine decarboxylase/phosphopantothenate--cysteine ligase CoaBC [Micrococcales bacterium 31B]
MPLAGARVILGVGGGIAAYKAALVLRLLTESGASVHVMPTESSLEFVGAATWEALSGNPVRMSVFDDVDQVKHVSLGQQADLVVVAPATANTLAKAAAGQADSLLLATLLVTRAPVVMFPAMHTEMWQHPATVANVATLRGRGVHVIEPAVGRLTGADTGPGRLPEPAAIFTLLESVRAGVAPQRAPQDLAGRHVVISAGGTREALDPVRYLTNRSSGRQGWALAEAALVRGARVSVVAANVGLDPIPGVETVRVESARELEGAVRAAAASADVVVMAAAVSDYRPAEYAEHKVKKSAASVGFTLELTQNHDILAGLVTDPVRPGQTVVGFAAETGTPTASVLDLAAAKIKRKGCDLLVANDVSGEQVFGRETNAVSIIDREGTVVASAEGSKHCVAHAIWDAVAAVAERR